MYLNNKNTKVKRKIKNIEKLYFFHRINIK